MTIEQEIERIRQAVVTEFDANRDVAISIKARKCAAACVAAVQRSIPLGMIDRHDLETVSTTEDLVGLLAKIEARGEAFKHETKQSTLPADTRGDRRGVRGDPGRLG